MQLDFTADQDELRDSVHSVLQREWPVASARALVERTIGAAEGSPAELTDALWATVAGLDWPALTIAEHHGGLGLGFVEAAVVAEEAGRGLAPGPLVSTITQFVPAVREVATDEQAGGILEEVAAGARTGSFAVAEDGGWDLAAVNATATPDGDGLVLSGSKRQVLDASLVDELVVVLRSPGTTGLDGLTAVVVPVDELALSPIKALDATRVLADVSLDGVRVPAERVLGAPGAAGPGLERALQEAAIAMALETVGTCQAIFDTNLDYAKNRVQFGVPVGSFQAVKHKLVNMFVAIERARATAYFAAATIEEDDPRRAVAAAMAKASAGDCQRLVAQDGIQLLGGIGYTWEHDQHLFVKRAKTGEVLFGSAAHHRAAIADALEI